MTEKLKIREHPVTGPFASGKVTKVVKSAADVVRLLDKGAGARHTLPTLRNPSGSSRSHAILALSVKHDTGEESIIRFIDLGGTGQCEHCSFVHLSLCKRVLATFLAPFQAPLYLYYGCFPFPFPFPFAVAFPLWRRLCRQQASC